MTAELRVLSSETLNSHLAAGCLSSGSPTASPRGAVREPLTRGRPIQHHGSFQTGHNHPATTSPRTVNLAQHEMWTAFPKSNGSANHGWAENYWLFKTQRPGGRIDAPGSGAMPEKLTPYGKQAPGTKSNRDGGVSTVRRARGDPCRVAAGPKAGLTAGVRVSDTTVLLVVHGERRKAWQRLRD